MKDTNHLKVLEEVEKSSLFVDFCLFSIIIIIIIAKKARASID